MKRSSGALYPASTGNDTVSLIVEFNSPEEPEQAITKLSPPPRPIPNLPPQGDNVVPFRRTGKQGKLPVPKVGSANDTEGGGGFQRIAEMKKIERRLAVSLRNWTKKGLL
jgi:hypothetical protein